MPVIFWHEIMLELSVENIFPRANRNHTSGGNDYFPINIVKLTTMA